MANYTGRPPTYRVSLWSLIRDHPILSFFVFLVVAGQVRSLVSEIIRECRTTRVVVESTKVVESKDPTK